MNATLTFNLPEDSCEFKIASNAMDWALVLHDLDQYLRGRLKYETLIKPVATALEAARERVSDFMSEKGISFDDIE